MWGACFKAGLLAFALATSIANASEEGKGPCDAARAPRVADIYPTSDALPANVLRFYIYFDAPMLRSNTLDRITLVDKQGNKMPDVFFPSRYALWSQDSRRLTVLMDPGRVKSGLDSSIALGGGLQPGHDYALIVDEGLSDHRGCLSNLAFRKDFSVTEAEVTIPDPASWRLTVPLAGSREAVQLQASASMDHLSLAYKVRVKNMAGEGVPGAIDVADNERVWAFTPRAPWLSQQYMIHIDPALEDVAGNRPTGLFDDPTGESRINQSNAETKTISFVPQSGAQ